MPFETSITHRIMEYFNNIDGVIMEKVKGEAECSGRADINGCYRGQSVRIEVKTPDNRNKPSKKQLYNLYQWNKAGALCMVVYSLDAVIHGFEEFKSEPTDSGHEIIEEKNNCRSLILYPFECSFMPFEVLCKVYYDDIQILD